jgi:hypothetical protein
MGDFDVVPARRQRRGGWSGGGGRWLVWTGRIILWALIAVIVVNGVRAPFERFTQGSSSTPNEVPVANHGFPVDRGMAFAAQFAGVYLNFSPADAPSRAGKLAAFLADGMDQQMGWDGNGKLAAVAIQPYDIDAADADNAVVTVAFQSGARRMMLSVPIYYSADGGGRFVVSGRPAILPAPARADLPQVAKPENDDAVAAELKPQLEDFFKNYGLGDSAGLQRYVAAGKSITSFGGAFTFAELGDIVVPVGGATREVQVEVTWIVPNGSTASPDPTATDPNAAGARLQQAYRLTVEKQGDKWYVDDIRGAGRHVG